MKRSPRLLLVTHELTRSGAPLLLYMTAKYLHKRGYYPFVLCPVDGPLREEYSQLGVDIHITPHILRDARVGFAWCERADIVICNTILTWRSVYSAKAAGTPCYWWVHESKFGVKMVEKHPEICDAFSTARQVIFPSNYTASQYVSFSLGKNFLTLHSGIELPRLSSSSIPAFEKGPGEFHLVCIATIENRKGQDILLSALKTLPAEVSRFVHLHLVGRTSIDTGFYRKIALHALLSKNVHIWGELSKEKSHGILQTSDAFVLASRDEALPVSLLEAMALAKPIISSKAGGIAEVITHGKNGLLVEIEDIAGLRDAIIQLFANPGLRQELGERAKQDFFHKHTIDAMGKKFLEILTRNDGREDI